MVRHPKTLADAKYLTRLSSVHGDIVWFLAIDLSDHSNALALRSYSHFFNMS